MENKQIHNKIITALRKEGKRGFGLSISDIQRELEIPRCSVRTAIAFLLGAGKVEEQSYGRAKVYYEVKNE